MKLYCHLPSGHLSLRPIKTGGKVALKTVPLCRSQSGLTGKFPEVQKASWVRLGLDARGGFPQLNLHVEVTAWRSPADAAPASPLGSVTVGVRVKTTLEVGGSPSSHAEANQNEREQGSQVETEVPEGL